MGRTREMQLNPPRFSEKVYNARGRLMFLKSFVVVIHGLLTAILTEKALVCFCILLRLNALVKRHQKIVGIKWHWGYSQPLLVGSYHDGCKGSSNALSAVKKEGGSQQGADITGNLLGKRRIKS